MSGQYVDDTIVKKSVRVGLDPGHGLIKTAGDESEDEDFTTHSSGTSLADKSDNGSVKSVVVALVVKDKEL